MGSYEDFEATHRIVATRDETVAACKRALGAKLSEFATELRVLVHPTERDNVPEAVAGLDAVAPNRAAFADDETERSGSFPDAERVVDAVLAEMDADGGLPVTALCFSGADFDVLVTSSASHSHVGKLACDDSTLVDELSDALAGVAVVVPAGPTVCWERDDTYFELGGPELCVYADRPANDADRRTTSHSCHDLTRLTAMDADGADGRIDLSWRETDSVLGRAMQAIFGRPPTELVLPDAEFAAAEAYLDRFVAVSESSTSE